MTAILIGFFTVVLVLVSAFLILVVLMQRASSNSGMGSALGGGAAESALGGEAGNVLTRATIIGAVLFFALAFGLYLAHMSSMDSGSVYGTGTLPTLADPEAEGDAITVLPRTTTDSLTVLPDELRIEDASAEVEAPTEPAVTSED